MILHHLKCRNYRNYDIIDVDFATTINVLVGSNAQGKTNVLEVIYFLCSTRSHRDVDDLQLIKDEKEFAYIEAAIERKYRRNLKVIINRGGKSLFINNNPISKTSDFIGELNTILFSPSDLEIFQASPRVRRKFLDLELGKISKQYLNHLKTYQQLLKERNLYLKESNIDDNYLTILTEQLINEMIPIFKIRQSLINFINENINRFYHSLSNTEKNVSLKYLSSLDDKTNEEVILMFQNIKEKELFQRQTLLGIHRDDFEFYLENKNVLDHASQGQRRMIVLALKLALIYFIKEKENDYPILLLDDVLSELDEDVRKNLFKVIPLEIQTFITTTDILDFAGIDNKEIRKFHVENGTIERV